MELKHLIINLFFSRNPAKKLVILIGWLILLFQYSCVEKNADSTSVYASPAFYHWKTNFSPGRPGLAALQQNRVRHLYMRVFDVAWDAASQKPVPVAQVRVEDKAFFKNEKLHIIPTVFITNECIHFIKPGQCKELAAKISKLVNEITQLNSMEPVEEIQIDCDWTASTREKYFTILSELQKIDTQHIFSATIRLFQVKYKVATGIPPVKKGLLMCYNMGDLKTMSTENSILDPSEVRKYINNLDEYPLNLDIGLPLFSWYVIFRQGGYLGLVQNIGPEFLKAIMKPAGKNRFLVTRDTLLNGSNLKQGDILRYEECSYADLKTTAALLKQKLVNQSPRIVLYHLDSIILSKYSTHEIEAIFNSFN